jgi:hypothetical protein
MLSNSRKSTETRYKQILEILPLHNWSRSKAAQAIGYTQRYAENRIDKILDKCVWFCEAEKAKKQEIKETSEDKITKLKQKLEKIAYDDNQPLSAQLKALDMLCKIYALYSETTIVKDETQRQLDEVQKQEARRLSIIALNDKYKGDAKAG